MIVEEIAGEPLTSIAQLNELIDTPPPCVSIYLGTYSPENYSIPFGVQFQSAVQRAKQSLIDQHGTESALLLPFDELLEFARAKPWEKRPDGLAVFCARNFIRIFRTARPVRESVHVGNEFHIKPLFAVLARQSQFGILALSQSHVSLLRCTETEAHEVELGPTVPRSVEQSADLNMPDHDQENRSPAGSAPGAMRRIRFGTGSAEGKTDEYTAQFFRIIDHEVNRIFRPGQLPVVLAALNREAALYRRINTYPYLLKRTVHPAPEKTPNSHLHYAALLVLDEADSEKEARLLSHFAQKQSRGLTLTDTPSILKAAQLGQIQTLFVAEPQSESENEQEELFNRIAIETIRHHGEIAALTHHRPPSGSAVAALLRYPAIYADGGAT